MRRVLLIVLMVAALAGVVFAPTSTAMAASGTRSLPSSLTAGANFDIDISTFDYGMFGQVVETLPSGFSYVSSTLSPAVVTEEGQVVKFTLLGETAFRYTITASSTAGTYTFSGILKDEDKVEYDVGGDSQITVTAPAPTGGSGGGGGDTTAPRISDISASGITETSADICWETNEKSDSQVEYWTSPSKLSPLDKTMVYDHLVHLADLTPGTIYHYKTMSIDRADNLTVSDVYAFTTKAEEVPPEEAPLPEEASPPEEVPPPPPPEEVPPPAKPPIPWPAVGGVIAAAVVVAGLGIFFWVRRIKSFYRQ